MDVMDDKQVGALWRRTIDVLALPHNGAVLNDWLGVAQNLIRKLVEERAKRWEPIVAQFGIAKGMTVITLALQDFGIDPKTWGVTDNTPLEELEAELEE